MRTDAPRYRPGPIEDYAVIGDTHTAALVSRHGSMDWLCVPRFDASACFAALLGDDRHGRWSIEPEGDVRSTRRRYRHDTLVLETELETDDGEVRLIDFMPPDGDVHEVVRIVEGVRGTVTLRSSVAPAFDYGSLSPWVEAWDGGVWAVAGPDALLLRGPDGTEAARHTIETTCTVREGDRLPFVLTWHPSHVDPPAAVDAEAALTETERWWREWAGECDFEGPRRDLVVRSLITLKALTYAPTGGIVAAATTSLPEWIGGTRNWDYRFCWVRDATFTLQAFMLNGYLDEAAAWRDWLLRAVAGEPDEMSIVFGPAGERRLPELELDWLPGYEGSTPVRIGNAADGQFQIDVYGEFMDALHQARLAGLEPSARAWDVQRALLGFLEERWHEPDNGIWEVRGARRRFTHSRVMAWLAFDRAVRCVDHFGLPGDRERWAAIRDEIHADVCENGWNPDRGAFTQYYGSDRLDASVLMLPLVGFLPAEDERMRATIERIEDELCVDGFVMRYSHDEPTEHLDGFPSGEGAFLPCSFWLADCLLLLGRREEAEAMFDRLCGLANDVGLLAEEYDPVAGRLLGNFPQAFTHVGLVNTACDLRGHGPSDRRQRPGE